MKPTEPIHSYWPAAIFGFFGLAVAFLASFIIWAGHQRQDLVATNYYDNEVRYQQQLDKLNRTLPLQTQVAVAYDPARQNIVISLPAVQAPGVTGQIVLYRPADERLDRRQSLSVDAGGVQRLDARPLEKGLWKVRVQWNAGGQDYFCDRSIVIPPQS